MLSITVRYYYYYVALCCCEGQDVFLFWSLICSRVIAGRIRSPICKPATRFEHLLPAYIAAIRLAHLLSGFKAATRFAHAATRLVNLLSGLYTCYPPCTQATSYPSCTSDSRHVHLLPGLCICYSPFKKVFFYPRSQLLSGAHICLTLQKKNWYPSHLLPSWHTCYAAVKKKPFFLYPVMIKIFLHRPSHLLSGFHAKKGFFS